MTLRHDQGLVTGHSAVPIEASMSGLGEGRGK
jgi:hypothetical protein